MRDRAIVDQARFLVGEGLTRRQAALQLGVHDTKVSRWCREIGNQNTLCLKNEKKRTKFSKLDGVTVKSISMHDARVLSALFYWCEGSKYPGTNTLSFTSSDPEMCEMFLQLLRYGFDIREDKLRIWLQLHSNQSEEQLFGYWSQLLKIPVSLFIKPKITNPTKSRYRVGYCGTCSIRYYDYSLIIRLMGIYHNYCRQVLGLVGGKIRKLHP